MNQCCNQNCSQGRKCVSSPRDNLTGYFTAGLLVGSAALVATLGIYTWYFS